MSNSSKPAFFAHANVFHHDGKPVPIKLFIATIPRDGSDAEVICITVNHAGLTMTPKDIRSINYTNARLRQVRPLFNSMPFEYFPFCARDKFSLLVQGNSYLLLVRGMDQQKIFQKLGLLTTALEMLPKDFCDGIFLNH
ncbi:hypothetical protein TNCV_3596851 [Trichonephila clavipes]|nr:hypothetical protein TNCV_3596851 [Trichonephila clavipes]